MLRFISASSAVSCGMAMWIYRCRSAQRPRPGRCRSKNIGLHLCFRIQTKRFGRGSPPTDRHQRLPDPIHHRQPPASQSSRLFRQSRTQHRRMESGFPAGILIRCVVCDPEKSKCYITHRQDELYKGRGEDGLFYSLLRKERNVILITIND